MAADPRCPYVGLAPFTAAEERFFFGRERETRLVINNLFASRLTLLYGPSGVGKSSVLGAGVLAELARRAQAEDAPSRIAVYLRRWQGDPLLAFRRAVLAAVRSARPEAGVPEPAAGEAAVDWLRRLTRELEVELLVLFDQFEEYFVYHEESGRRASDPFARQLAAMVERVELPVSFLLGLRDDALARLDRFKALIPDLFENYLRLEPLSDEAAREAIVRPLECWNEGLPPREQVRLGEGLVDHVVAQVRREEDGAGGRGRPAGRRAGIQAPLLQLVMTRLWTAPTDSRVLSISTLEKELGGAEGIVEAHLDSVMEDLSGAERDLCGRMFEYLVTPSGSKIAHSAADLAGFAKVDEKRVRPLLAKLAGAEKRLLATVAPLVARGEELYEIYHDALGRAVLAWQQRWAAARERARTRRVLLILAAFALIAAVAVGAMWSARSALRQARESAEQVALQEREVARLSEQAVLLEQKARSLEREGRDGDAEKVREELAIVRRQQARLAQKIEVLGVEIGGAPAVEPARALAALESENESLRAKLEDLAKLLDAAESDADLQVSELTAPGEEDRAGQPSGSRAAVPGPAESEAGPATDESSGAPPVAVPDPGDSESESERSAGGSATPPPPSGGSVLGQFLAELLGRSEGTAPPESPPRVPPVGSDSASDAPRWRDPVLGMTFRYLPAGSFMMGSPEDEPGRDEDEVLHKVELSRGFWMAETEVTQEQWRKLMGNNPSRYRGCGPGCPVETVSWWDAVTFANRLSEAADLEQCYVLNGCRGEPGTSGYSCESARLGRGLDCGGYRLPTEAEWEYAARAGTPTAIYTGDLTVVEDRLDPKLDAIAWYSGNSGGHPHPVGAKAANAWGLHDMLGNVWEWTWDWGATYPTLSVVDPMGPEQGADRVIRGGSWGDFARYARSAYRGWLHPGARNDFLGFRLARGQ